MNKKMFQVIDKINYESFFEERAKVFLFFLVFIFVSLLGFFFFARKTEFVTVRLFLTEREWAKTWDNYPDYFFTQNLKQDLIEKNELGQIIAKVDKIYSNELPFSHNQVMVDLTVKANLNKKTGVYSFQGNPIIIGDYQRLRIGNTRIQGYVMNVGTALDKLESKKMMVTVVIDDVFESDRAMLNSRAAGIPKQTAAILEEGLSINDVNGDSILKIVAMDLKPTERVFFDKTGLVHTIDNDLISGELTLEMSVHQINGSSFWNYTVPLQVGHRTSLHFKQAHIPIRIVEIIE